MTTKGKTLQSHVRQHTNAKRPKNAIEALLNQAELSFEDLSSSEMVLIMATMLESRGYHGMLELMSALEKPEILIKIIRLFYGMTIQIPPLRDWIDTINAIEYIFLRFHKEKMTDTLTRDYMGISEFDEERYIEIFDNWVQYLANNNCDLSAIMHMNSNALTKRYKNVTKRRLRRNIKRTTKPKIYKPKES